jgi:hypothetical protein
LSGAAFAAAPESSERATAEPAGRAQHAAPSSIVREITWDDLLPAGWTPPVAVVDHFFDAPPQPAVAAGQTPVVDELNNQRVRLPGYLVPLALDGGKVREFLMVPYFGACIHVPPPPPNQIVFVRLGQAVPLDDPYGAHWVTGVLSTSTSSTELAEAAYTMVGERVEVFSWDRLYAGDSED